MFEDVLVGLRTYWCVWGRIGLFEDVLVCLDGDVLVCLDGDVLVCLDGDVFVCLDGDRLVSLRTYWCV